MNTKAHLADISLFESISNASGNVCVVNGWGKWGALAGITALALAPTHPIQTYHDVKAIRHAQKVAADVVPGQQGVHRDAMRQNGVTPNDYANGQFALAGAPDEKTRNFHDLLEKDYPAVFQALKLDTFRARNRYKLIQSNKQQTSMLLRHLKDGSFDDDITTAKSLKNRAGIDDSAYVYCTLVELVNTMPKFVKQCVKLSNNEPGRLEAFFKDEVDMQTIQARKQVQEQLQQDAQAYRQQNQETLKQIRQNATPAARFFTQGGNPPQN